MWNWNSQVTLSKSEIMKVFWSKVAGQEIVQTGNMEYIRPLNYRTDDRTVIVSEQLPVLNLTKDKLPIFEDALTEYVKTFFASERYWANPVKSCNNQMNKLVHAISTLWLNATFDDYENPVSFIRRYTNFLKDHTFDEFFEKTTISRLQTLQNCSLVIEQKEQEEFQETPTAMVFTVIKDGIRKTLPRIAYGVSNGVAYIYGIQGYKWDDEGVIKKVNRSRFGVNQMDNIPEDYKNVFLKQEPYAYISLFAFMSMLRQKGINKIVMPSYLPQRYESKEIGISNKEAEIEEKLESLENSKGRRQALKEIDLARNEHQRVQYNITNKFLFYMTRMECDVPGIKIIQTPDENNGSLVIDISKMKVAEKPNIIFYEIYKKIEGLIQEKKSKVKK